MKSLAILGSTGSVGKSTLDVIRENKDEFKIELLTARTNFRLMAEQCKEFTPKFVYLENKEAQKSFLDELGTNNPQVTLLSDEKELNQIIASQDLEIVVAAMVGIVGLKPVFQAIKHGKHILLANILSVSFSMLSTSCCSRHNSPPDISLYTLVFLVVASIILNFLSLSGSRIAVWK